MQTCTCSESAERARESAHLRAATEPRAHKRNAGYLLLLSALIIKLTCSLAHSLSLTLSSCVCVCVCVCACSRQITLVVASKLIRLHQSAFKRDGVHLVEPCAAPCIANSRESLLVCACVCVCMSARVIFAIQIDND